ncbi:MAG: hypothetical protein LBR40_06530, partial [Bacilli bacterium]|nr:hypothetical protein [Bacilli bacterium]
MAYQRKYGEEQPYHALGPFKLRIPFIHYKVELADYLQGLVMCAVCLSAIPLLQSCLGMPAEVAIAVVVLNGILYCTHVLLGDPVVPGWVTPAIPLLMSYIMMYNGKAEMVKALIAFELMLGLLAIVLGITKLGKKLVAIIPSSIQSGLIIGAGISAIIKVFDVTPVLDANGVQTGMVGYFWKYPFSIVICIGLAMFLLFSNRFRYLAKNNKFLGFISNLGILPVMILAIFVGPIFCETVLPHFGFGSNVVELSKGVDLHTLGGFITLPDFKQLFTEWTFVGVGFPDISYFIKGIPMVIAAYIILFGDMVQADALLKDAAKKRPDEKIDYNPNRSHLIFGFRNTFMSIFGPDITMCGPLWAAMQVVVTDRYKKGRKSMDSIHGGTGSVRLGTLTGYLLTPIVCFVYPILGIALTSTLLIQGYVSVRVGVQKARTVNDIGIA